MSYTSVIVKQKQTLQVFVLDDITQSVKNKLLTRGEAALLRSYLRANKNVLIKSDSILLRRLERHSAKTHFSMTFAIGSAGTAIGQWLHNKTGAFPHIETIPLQRHESRNGKHVISLAQRRKLRQLMNKKIPTKIAIIDDTIYSGLTIKTLISCLPPKKRKSITIFCLQAIAQSLVDITPIAQINSGIVLSGRRERDITIIKASGLYTSGAIRTEKGNQLAFCERSQWLSTWFPKNALQIQTICYLILNRQSEKNQQFHDDQKTSFSLSQIST